MRLVIKTTGTTLTPTLQSYVEEKLGGLERFFRAKENPEMQIEIGKPSKHHKKGDVFYAEANLKLSSKLFRATSQNWDLRIAIDEVRHHLERQVTQYKDKLVASHRKRTPETD